MILNLDLNYDCGKVKVWQDITVTDEEKVTIPKEIIGEDGEITIEAQEIGTIDDKYCLFRKDLPYPLQIFTFEENGKLEYVDSIVEQGQTYGYGLYIKESPEVWNETSDPSFCDVIWDFITVDFEDIFLSDKDHVLCIKYNPQISSFKTIIAEQKIETIGSKFPFFFRNGNLGYKEIPLGGLITYQADNLMLFNPSFKYEYYPEELGRTATKNNSSFVNRTLRDEFYLERKYKRQIEEWLNNGQPKLLRTAAEGSFIVRLMNISLTPMDQLGRRLHSFTATAYEIADFKQEELIKNGFISFNGEEKVAIINENGNTLLPLRDYTGLVIRGDLDSSMIIRTKKDERALLHFFIPELEEGTTDNRFLIYNSQTIYNGTLGSRPVNGLKYILNPLGEGRFKVIPDKECTLNISKYTNLELKNQSFTIGNEKLSFKSDKLNYGAKITFSLLEGVESASIKCLYASSEEETTLSLNTTTKSQILRVKSDAAILFLEPNSANSTKITLEVMKDSLLDWEIEQEANEAEEEENEEEGEEV